MLWIALCKPRVRKSARERTARRSRLTGAQQEPSNAWRRSRVRRRTVSPVYETVASRHISRNRRRNRRRRFSASFSAHDFAKIYRRAVWMLSPAVTGKYCVQPKVVLLLHGLLTLFSRAWKRPAWRASREPPPRFAAAARAHATSPRFLRPDEKRATKDRRRFDSVVAARKFDSSGDSVMAETATRPACSFPTGSRRSTRRCHHARRPFLVV